MIKRTLILILIIPLLNCCNHPQKTIENSGLCYEFYQQNKNIKFKVLFDISHGDRQGIEEINDGNNFIHTFKGIRVHNVYCALFDSSASIALQKQTYKERLFPEAKEMLIKHYDSLSKSVDTFGIYKNFVTKFYQEYNQIRMPASSHSRNTLIFTNNELGKYIQFLLSVKSEKDKYYGLFVFYFPEENTLNKEYWKTKKLGLVKIASNWYYCENIPMQDGHPH